METQTKTTDWLKDELANANQPTQEFEKLETLKLESGKITRFTVDFNQPFKKWKNEDGTIKAIIPVTHKEVKKNLWLNTKNPLYSQICKHGVNGVSEFRVSTTGSQKDTRYEIVTED